MAHFQIKHRCPHCSELCDFQMSNLTELYNFQYPPEKPPLWEPAQNFNVGAARIKTTVATQGCALSRCPRCYNPVMFVITAPFSIINEQSRQLDSRIVQSYHVNLTYPEAKKYESHPSWPQKIQQPFIEAQSMLDERKTPAFIISACRSVLDVSTKELNGSGSNIFERVEDLGNKGVITGALRDWAHEVRKRGADAVHDLDGGSHEQAREFVEFIRLFLHVTFELPDAILKKRQTA